MADVPDLATFTEYTRQNYIALLLDYGGITFFVYDYFLTLEQEIALVWSARPHWSIAKVLFYLNRYYALFTYLLRVVLETHDKVTNRVGYLNECRGVVIREIMNWSTVLNFLIAEVILMLAVWATWSRDRTVGIILVVSFLLVDGVAIGIKDIKLGNLVTANPPPTSMFSCAYWPPSSTFCLYIFSLGLQLMCFVMFLYKTIQLRSRLHGVGKSAITQALWMHGGMYYVVVIALQLMGICSTLNTSWFLIIDTAQPMIPIMSITSTRLLLSLRKIIFQGIPIATDVTLTTTRPEIQALPSSGNDTIITTTDFERMGDLESYSLNDLKSRTD